MNIMCMDVNMAEHFQSHQQVLELWRPLAVEGRLFKAIAADTGFPRRRIQQWHRRNNIRPEYWPHLIEVVEQRFGIVLTPRQLMLAAARRFRTKEAA